MIAFLVAPPNGRRFGWILTMGPVAALLSAFWVLPFVGRRAYLNDMGWERLPLEGSDLTVRDFLAPRSLVVDHRPRLCRAHHVDCPGAGGSGLFLAGLAVAAALAFALMPEARLWNARMLPLWYLALCLLAAIGTAELGRAFAVLLARDPTRPAFTVEVLTGVVGVFCAVAIAGVHLGKFPGGEETADGGLPVVVVQRGRRGPIIGPGLGRLELQRLRGQGRLPRVLRHGQDDGGRGRGDTGAGELCGSTASRLGQYGTPMAPMLLPFWTDGCIGSMEGLFFESSTTTPYHFLSQSGPVGERLTGPARLPYTPFDINLGVATAPADGCPLLHGDRGDLRRSRGQPSRARGDRGVGPVAHLSRGQLGARLAARERTGGAERRLVARGLDRGQRRLVPGPDPVGRASGRRRPRGVATDLDRADARGQTGRPSRRCATSRRRATGSAST